jgi:FkbM family methyltransferase
VLAGFGRSMNRLYENRNHDIHSNGEVWLLKNLSKFKPEIIFDGGANVGQYATEVVINCPNARIHCFEPVPGTFNLLKISLEKFPEQILPVPKGLSDENRRVFINLFEYDEHASIFSHNGITPDTRQQIEIEVIKGDDYLADTGIEKIDFLKLDIEGAEMKALKGFEKSLRAKKIRLIQFEYGYLNILTKNLLVDYYDYLEPFGYKIGKLYPKKVEFKPYHSKLEDFIGPNYVAILNSEEEMINSLS